MAAMHGVWELLSYLRGDQTHCDVKDSQVCDLREPPPTAAEATFRRELEELHTKVANQKQEILDLTNQVLACRDREEQATARLTAQLADVTRLRNDLSEANEELADRERQLQEGAQQLRHRQALFEDASLELNQRSSELSRCTEQMQKLEVTAAQARAQTQQLTEQLTAQNKQLEWLETQLKTAKLAVAAAAAAPPPPPAVDPTEVAALREELDSVRESLRLSEQERASEIRMIQEVRKALDGALQERAEMESRYRTEVEQLKTMTAEREAQLMEDAETRLRELQKSWKTRLDEKEKAAEARALEVRKTVETEMEAELAALSKQRADVEQKQGEVELLRSFEAEVVALRGLTHELMQELKTGTRQMEDIKQKEACTSEENQRLNQLISKQTSTINNMQKELQKAREASEAQLGQTRASLAAEWEQRVQEERDRLHTELEARLQECTQQAVEQERKQAEQDVSRLREEIRTMQQELEEKNASNDGELNRAHQSSAQSSEDPSSLATSPVEDNKESSPLVNGHRGGTDVESAEESAEEGEEEDQFDEEDSEAAGEEIRRRHKRDLEHLLRTSQDQRADLKLMLETCELRAAQTQEQLRRVHAERDAAAADPYTRPVPGAARLAAVLTALQECGDQLVRLIAAKELQKMRSVRVLVPARMRQFGGAPPPP